MSAAHTSTTDRPSVAVVGGGVIGLGIAWTLAERGCAVTLADPDPGKGASHAAAGMLAPVSEAAYDEDALLTLGLHSLAMWPDFGARLEAASGTTVGLRREGSLLVAHDAGDGNELRRLGRLIEVQARDGVTAERLTSRDARRLEPALSPRTSAAMVVAGEASVDNRRVVRALLCACERVGVRIVRGRASVVTSGGRVTGIRTDEGTYAADVTVLAAGASSATVPGVPEEAIPPVRPVKGQILRLHGEPGLLTHTVRAVVRGRPVYLVPRADGEVVLGATSEDIGDDTSVTAGAVHDLLCAATTIVPEVGELRLVEFLSRTRPTTPDNAPLIGATAVPGLVHATGHYRGGVLLAPVTAAAVADVVAPAAASTAHAALLRAFDPTRFADSTLPATHEEALVHDHHPQR